MFQEGHSQRIRGEKDDYKGFETPYQMPCGISGEARHDALPRVETRRQHICKELLFLHGEESHDLVGEISRGGKHIPQFASGASLSRGLHEVTHISKFNADNDFVQAMSNRRHH